MSSSPLTLTLSHEGRGKSPSLVLQHPAVWRGDQYAKVAVASVPTGFAELDAQLPGGGWPRAALTELLINQQGIGELRLLAPALAHLSREDKWLALVAPPHLPYAPGFESLGVDLARLIVVRTRSNGESLWAAERCLRAGTCAAVIAWPGPGSERSLRRLQLAAEEGKSCGMIFGPTRNAAHPSPAVLRIQLRAGRGRLEVQILKRRGGGWAPPLTLELDGKRLPHPSSAPALLDYRLRADDHKSVVPAKAGTQDAQAPMDPRLRGDDKVVVIPAQSEIQGPRMPQDPRTPLEPRTPQAPGTPLDPRPSRDDMTARRASFPSAFTSTNLPLHPLHYRRIRNGLA